MKVKEKIPFFLPLFFSLLVIYYPVIFGFFISPNDIYYHYDPWRYGSFSYGALNPILNDPATAYWTKAYLFKTEPKSLFYNPYIGSGMPGMVDMLSGILNPFVLIPLLFPMELFFSGMFFLKVLVAYLGMYLFLKTFNLNSWAISLGSISYALFGQQVVWGLWPQTNISSLFPWFFYFLTLKNRGYKFLGFFFLFLFSAFGGYPPYIIIFSIFFLLYILFVNYKDSLNKIKSLILPLIFSFFFLLPFLYISYFDLIEMGRLELRKDLAEKTRVFPLNSLYLFISPYHFGLPQDFNLTLKEEETFNDYSIYMGISLPLLLPLGFFFLKDSRKRFFLISILLLFFLLFFNTPLRFIISKIPGISYTSLSRLTILLGFSISIACAFGYDLILNIIKNNKLNFILPLIISIDLGFFATQYFSYQKYGEIKPKTTEAISFLKEKLKDKPFRVLGLYDSLWPNSSEYTKIPDIRSHFSSESWYREFLAQGDENVSKIMGTFLLLWDAKKIHSPNFSALFVKYITEPPFINTIKPEIDLRTKREIPEKFIEVPKYGIKRKVHFEATPYKISFYIKEKEGRVILNLYEEFTYTFLSSYEVLERGGEYFVILERPWEYNLSKVYLELVPEKYLKIGAKGEDFSINVQYSPYILIYEGRDLRIFENRCVEEPVILTFDASSDFPKEPEKFRYFSFFEKKDLREVERFLREKEGNFKIGKVFIENLNLYGGDFKISTKSNSILVLPFKYNPLWSSCFLDGEKVKIYKVNGALSGVLVPEGEHFLHFSFGVKFLPYLLISLTIFSLGILFFIFLL